MGIQLFSEDPPRTVISAPPPPKEPPRWGGKSRAFEHRTRQTRTFHIVWTLSQGVTTADVLALQLGVNVRTIYRDVDWLRAHGVPVMADRGFGMMIGAKSLKDSEFVDAAVERACAAYWLRWDKESAKTKEKLRIAMRRAVLAVMEVK
jgi:predicted DNA-binding transcriptional regulator YafY